MEKASIYNYIDYRTYLEDIFNYKKQKNKHFSFRVFARKAEFTSPSFIKLVMNGQRNLTNKSVAKVAKGLGLKKREREFFENLVFMNQASNHDEKNHYYQKMMLVKGYSNIHKIEKAKYEYFSKWYYPVIREVVTFGGGKLSIEEIANMLSPKLAPDAVAKAIAHLTELGLIKKKLNGVYVQCNKDIQNAPEIDSLTIGNFHREMMKMAAEAIERHPPERRDISAITMSVQQEIMPELKKRIDLFRKELLGFRCDNDDSNQVVQINIQVFPFTD